MTGGSTPCPSSAGFLESIDEEQPTKQPARTAVPISTRKSTPVSAIAGSDSPFSEREDLCYGDRLEPKARRRKEREHEPVRLLKPSRFPRLKIRQKLLPPGIVPHAFRTSLFRHAAIIDRIKDVLPERLAVLRTP